MITVVRVGALEIGIQTKEMGHPRAHAHATYPRKKNPEAEASIALDNFEVLASRGFDRPTLNRIVELVEGYQEELMALWEELHG